MMNEPISSIMTSDLITLSPNNTLGEARAIFLEKRIHHLPIVDGKKLVGLVTSWDIFKLGKGLGTYNDMLVSEVMTTHLAVLGSGEHIGTAAEVLMEHLFHAVPIVDEDHNLEGIVTTYDLLKYSFNKEYPKHS